MKRRNVRTLSLIIVTFTYLLIGAAIFDALEGPNNEKAYKALQEVKGDFIEKYNITNEDYRIIEVMMIEKKSHKSGPQWKFAGSFYYALVVLALIGYGHSTPATTLGKAFTMAYAAAGIPLAMVMFQSMGERMNKFYSVTIKKFRRWNGRQDVEASEFDLLVCSGITSSVVTLAGAVMYHFQEGWSFFDSLYYTFITLSTIGFGDFVALQDSRALQTSPGYVICSFLFLLVGLASLSASVNLLVLRFMIISLEEEDQEDAADAANENILTLEHELIAMNMNNANGRPLAGVSIETQQADSTSERNIYAAGKAARSPSVCSCTCYGGGGGGILGPNGVLGGGDDDEDNERVRRRGHRSTFSRIFGCCTDGRGGLKDEDGNFYDEETQSISNHARFAIKRASF